MRISIPRTVIWQKKSKIYKFKMAVGRHIENFLLYFGAILVELCEILTADVESHANTGNVTKTAIFE